MTEGGIGTEIKEVEPRLRVLIIDMYPGEKRKHVVRISQELFGTDADSVEKFARVVVTSIKTKKPGGEPDSLYLPGSVDDFAAIVVTGSPKAAYPVGDGNRLFLASWTKELLTFIRKANEHKIPYLGICFGEQALAEAMGGTVQKMRSKKGEEVEESSWGIVRKAPGANGDPLIGELSDEFVAPENHKDIVARLSEGAELLAENEYGVQGFRIGNSWGFEFHPERRPPKVEEYFGEEKNIESLKQQGKDPEVVRKLGDRYNADLRNIFTNFLEYALAHRQ